MRTCFSSVFRRFAVLFAASQLAGVALAMTLVMTLAITPATAADKMPLAIKGYDPVAYFTLGKAMPGRPELEYEWDEQRYFFSRPEHRERFKADPARYAPRFANLCAIALARGEIVAANPEYWIISEGKLYLFGKPQGPALFQQDVATNVAKAEANRPR
jgi:YHS domain-containing protein